MRGFVVPRCVQGSDNPRGGIPLAGDSSRSIIGEAFTRASEARDSLNPCRGSRKRLFISNVVMTAGAT